MKQLEFFWPFDFEIFLSTAAANRLLSCSDLHRKDRARFIAELLAENICKVISTNTRAR
jgi:hypothetical protein